MKRVWTQIDLPKVNVLGACAWIHIAATGSDSSRRFCSVTAVVCRRFSHMTAERREGGLYPPHSVVFGARWRLWRCCWYPWCIWIDVRRRKHWKHGDAGCIQWHRHRSAYVACRGGMNVSLMPLFLWHCSVVTHCRCCVVVKTCPSGCFWNDPDGFWGGPDEPFCPIWACRMMPMQHLEGQNKNVCLFWKHLCE